MYFFFFAESLDLFTFRVLTRDSFFCFFFFSFSMSEFGNLKAQAVCCRAVWLAD